MLSRLISPQIWRPLLKQTVSDLKWILLIGALFVCVILVPAFNSELNATAEHLGSAPPGRLTLAQRLGYAILLNSDLSTIENLTDTERENRREQGALPWPMELSPTAFLCIPKGSITVGARVLDIQLLSVAIISAEMYNRDMLTRKIKAIVGRLYHNWVGSYPNFSYGVSQVKLPTARPIIATMIKGDPSDSDVFELLQIDCDNMNIASKYMRNLAETRSANSSGLNELIREVSNAYTGVAHNSEGSFLYNISVLGAYYLLRSNDHQETEDEKNSQATFCIGFDRGETAATESTDLTSFLEEHHEATKEEVKVELWTDELRPTLYKSALAAARRQWLVTELKGRGFEENQIKITDIGPTLPKGLAQCNLSFAEVTLRIPSPDPSNPSDAPPSEVTTPPLTMQPGAAASDVPITLPAPSRKNPRKYLSNGAGKPSPRPRINAKTTDQRIK